MILEALKDCPTAGILVRKIESIAQGIEVDVDIAAPGAFSDDRPQAVAKGVAVTDIEAHSIRRDGDTFPPFSTPVFGDLNGTRLDKAQGVREVLGKVPAATFCNHRDLI